MVRVDRNTVRVLDNNGLRYCIGNPANLALVLPQLLFRTLTIFYVRTASIPANDFAALVAMGNRADEEPSIFAIETPEPERILGSCDDGLCCADSGGQ